MKRQRHKLTSQTRQMKDKKMGCAGYCLYQLHLVTLISAFLILDSITQQCAVLKTKAVVLEPTLLAVDGWSTATFVSVINFCVCQHLK